MVQWPQWTAVDPALSFSTSPRTNLISSGPSLIPSPLFLRKLKKFYHCIHKHFSCMPTNVHLVKAMVFPVVMYGCESWTIKTAEHRIIDAFELCWRRLLRAPWTAGTPSQSTLKEISPECSLEGLMLKLKLQYFLATWCEELTHLKRPWCWERLKVGGEGNNRGWDDWMASPTQWTWVWVNSGSWWGTGRPGVLQSMELQRVGHDWATELNWTEQHTHPSSSSMPTNPITGLPPNRITSQRPHLQIPSQWGLARHRMSFGGNTNIWFTTVEMFPFTPFLCCGVAPSRFGSELHTALQRTALCSCLPTPLLVYLWDKLLEAWPPGQRTRSRPAPVISPSSVLPP